MGANAEIVRRGLRSFNERRLDDWVENFTHDVEVPALALAGSEPLYRGIEGLRRWFGELEASGTRIRVLPDRFIEVDNLVVMLGKIVVEQGDGRGYGALTGMVYAFDGDKVRRVDNYPHPDMALGAAGLDRSLVAASPA